MKRTERFLANGLMLTLTGLLMRFVGLLWNAWSATRLGEAGVGLFSLVGSVYGLAVTFSTSGVSFACSRLVARAIGEGREERLCPIAVRCMCYGALFGLCGMVGLHYLAEPVGSVLLQDVRTVPSLRLLSYSLPAVSLSSALSGYFTGVRRLFKNTVVGIGEQALRMAVTVWAISHVVPNDLERACVALCLGTVTAATVSCVCSGWIWIRDVRRHASGRTEGVTSEVLHTALPIAVSTYLRSGLLTLEHLLIPHGLKKSGSDNEGSLTTYGVIHGMAFPVILFPQAFTAAFTSLLVPEMAEAQARGDRRFILRNCTRVLRFTFLFSIGTSAVLLCLSQELGILLYRSSRAGRYLSCLALLVPVMYTDSAVDHMLKGLGQQFYSMCVNIVDSALSVIAVWYLLPRYGIKGYLFVLFFCEIINCTLSFGRLLFVTELRVRGVRWLFLPLLAAVISLVVIKELWVFLPPLVSWWQITLCGGCVILLYLLLCYAFGSIGKRDLAWIKRRIKKRSAPADCT